MPVEALVFGPEGVARPPRLVGGLPRAASRVLTRPRDLT